MKLVAESGLWTTGAQVAAPPAVAVLEVAGAVLAWTVDDPAATAQLTFTDVAAADWLWRVAGEHGHVAVIEALRGRAADPHTSVDIADLELSPQMLAPLRRLALGHWLRRWWPASARDSIADLDIAVLDAELAVLTAAAQEFFGEDTLDSDIEGLLRPHRAALSAHLRDGDPRVAALIEPCLELADWAESAAPEEVSGSRRRDDYALAAGGPATSPADTIGAGTASISWSAVPPGVFDAAEDTVDWSVRGDGAGGAVADLRAVVSASAAGVPVRLRSGDVIATGVLDERGGATLALPLSESAAWNRDWAATSVTVGQVGSAEEDRATRDRLRAFARSRLAVPAADAFLAEILAAESDY
ncbi:hypothetical protein [Mycolicibacterium sp. P9-22]|uniref:hypothetical protein n=1 Tax=Mycolicibacterium sp. P9-22 TaxID=2024613 RepID=UPI0011ED93AD|nr:hypothetical protein [Mycolicibacterium sp. P9-22]KAA0109103.1 hypothetical protein CIW51_31545 [Mycolicibacterium sp. P9-22]